MQSAVKIGYPAKTAAKNSIGCWVYYWWHRQWLLERGLLRWRNVDAIIAEWSVSSRGITTIDPAAAASADAEPRSCCNSLTHARSTGRRPAIYWRIACGQWQRFPPSSGENHRRIDRTDRFVATVTITVSVSWHFTWFNPAENNSECIVRLVSQKVADGFSSNFQTGYLFWCRRLDYWQVSHKISKKNVDDTFSRCDTIPARDWQTDGHCDNIYRCSIARVKQTSVRLVRK